MSKEPLGTGLVDTLNNGLKQAIKHLAEMSNKLENVEKKLDLANEAINNLSLFLQVANMNENKDIVNPPLGSPPRMKKVVKRE